MWSLISFGWLSELFDVQLGYSRILTPSDLPPLKTSDVTATSAAIFHQFWREELENSGYSYQSQQEVEPSPTPWYRNVIGAKSPPSPSLLRALRRSFGGRFFFGAVFKLGNDISTFTLPPLLGLLIGFANSRLSGVGTPQPVENGVLISVAMFMLATFQSICVHQYFQTVINVGMRLRTALCSAVYRKSLVLAPGAKGTSTSGEITNLMSADSQRIANSMNYLHMAWSAPLQITIALTLLYQQLGPSIFGGVAVMILATPVNTFVARLRKRFEEEQMELRDERVKIMDELLMGIKVIKLYAWEKVFLGKVEKVRDGELNLRRRLAGLSAALYLTWSSTPFFVSLAAFSLYSMVETAPLTSTKIFVSLSLFNLLTFPLIMLPNVISGVIQASVSMQRVKKFLLSDEINREAVERLPAPVVQVPLLTQMITVEGGSFSWSLQPGPAGETSETERATNNGDARSAGNVGERNKSVKAILSGIDFKVLSGECVAVVGRVGAGKTSIVSAVLGEMKKLTGRVEVRGKVAYVSQVAWILNVSLRDNVLFGNDWDEEWYNKVIDACALRTDFAILPGGDQTEIGERGINLSGGQKQRVSLARAVYSRADVYLLDDPLSAVDSHVGRHIFENVVGKNGLLATKTRLFVTHGIHFLPDCDRILMVQDGRIIAQGKHQELLAQSPPVRNGAEGSSSSSSWSYAELVRDLEVENKPDEDLGDETEREEEEEEELLSEASDELNDSARKPVTDRRKSSTDLKLRLKQAEAHSKAEKDLEQMNKIIQKEELRTGSVSFSTYAIYAEACGYGNIVIYLVLAAAQQAFSVGGAIWLADWSKTGDRGDVSSDAFWRISIYAALGMGQVVFTIGQQLAINMLCAIRAAWKLHNRMLHNIINCPQSFFDQTPTGRVLNRFAKDIELVDETVPMVASGVVWDILYSMSALLVNAWISPVFGLAVIPVLSVYVYVGLFYLATTREIKRLESASRSPVYAFFNETLGGLPVIRAFGQSQRFISTSDSRIDTNSRAYFPYVSSNRWLGFRLELLGNALLLAACLSTVAAVALNWNITASFVGLAISFALSIGESLSWVIRECCDVETNIVAVERITEYSEVPNEAPHYIPDRTPPNEWPSKGEVTFSKFSTRYRPNLPLVLNDINLNIPSANKYGLIGRTGSGKSSLALSLFRIIEPSAGTIVIDGVDISTIGLHDLRSRVTIIPQESLLFQGTIRENLDPFGDRSDADCWRALDASGLSDHVKNMEGKLDAKVLPGGENLSVGQRQLICLARALLRRTKVLVLDEATASVDKQTDDFIQETIRKEFSDCTILTIAHRIGTVLDYDRIVVLGPASTSTEGGTVLECGEPTELMNDSSSKFHEFAKQAGLVGKRS
ncbi:multidrug resistance protein 3 [Gonapodya prolifera JEL478]|uniref:Multidrug resistance protein 3 n=1 Tax=Gonapodya prolifera (strain JEL478) TaxID=1344416 RepID=A0A139AAC0_GONPJ|nr:multidrug resistance protein 3 [Gonapodya prolifera JEL478]|eukprot:KXS13313.1 multidrug resistance protein 3 [Gonapodya prolifera JEL478]